MLTLDGSRGEGGGQILRTSLALSAATGTPLRLVNIRARRKRPGLGRQHLVCVEAAAAVCGAAVTGARLGSREITFAPGPVRAGDHAFSIGSAGSATLVLQTVLWPLLRAEGPSRVRIEGGTHNPLAPPYDFLAAVFLPLLERMGARVETRLLRHGFYPAGGGRLEATVHPCDDFRPLELMKRGRRLGVSARCLLARLPAHIAGRELKVLAAKLDLGDGEIGYDIVQESDGPGNVLLVTVRCEHATELFSSVGRKGVKAESVAANLAREVRRFLSARVPVGEHLADQILLPLAFAGGGTFRTVEPSTHTRTNAEVIETFLPVRIGMNRCADDTWVVEVVSRSA